jgi:hypothetical protein
MKEKTGLVRAGELLKPLLTKQTVVLPVIPKETSGADQLPKPQQPEFENQQLGLFQHFLCNTDDERDQLSNAIDLWDSVPRYSVSRQAMTKARLTDRFLEKHRAEFQYKGRTMIRTIYPARVQDQDGVDRDYYASATEELVEDALRKLAAEQQAGYFDKPNYRSGVVFTLYALRQELKKRGHTRSYQEIVLALNILSGSIIEITAKDDEKGEFRTRSAYLPHVAAVSRHTLREDPKAKWLVQFHPLVTGSIDKLTYRQFNYHLMMSHRTQLARWLHKQLALKYTFASITAPFEMRYSTIKRDSGLLNAYGRPRDAIDTLQEAFTELKSRAVLLSFERKNITGPRGKLLDAVFVLTPSLDYIRDTKASSKRLSNATDTSRKPVGMGRGFKELSVGMSRG